MLSSLKVHDEADHAQGASHLASVGIIVQADIRVAQLQHTSSFQRHLLVVSATQAVFALYQRQVTIEMLSSLKVQFEAGHKQGATQLVLVVFAVQVFIRAAQLEQIPIVHKHLFLVSATQAAFVVYPGQVIIQMLSSLKVHYEADHAHGAEQLASVVGDEQVDIKIALVMHVVYSQRQVFQVSATQAAFVVYAMQAVIQAIYVALTVAVYY